MGSRRGARAHASRRLLAQPPQHEVGVDDSVVLGKTEARLEESILSRVAAEMLEELLAELATRQVDLTFAELKDPVKDRLLRYGLRRPSGVPTAKGEPEQPGAPLDDTSFFPTIGVAVKAFLAQNDVAWTDWEDRPAG